MKWYQKTWVAWLFLFLFFPVGLFLLWKYSSYSTKAKGAITAVFLVLIAVSMATRPPKDTQQPIASSLPPIFQHADANTGFRKDSRAEQPKTENPSTAGLGGRKCYDKPKECFEKGYFLCE